MTKFKAGDKVKLIHSPRIKNYDGYCEHPFAEKYILGKEYTILKAYSFSKPVSYSMEEIPDFILIEEDLELVESQEKIISTKYGEEFIIRRLKPQSIKLSSGSITIQNLDFEYPIEDTKIVYTDKYNASSNIEIEDLREFGKILIDIADFVDGK